jgi:tetratricopeptide (TPR) repeat protein
MRRLFIACWLLLRLSFLLARQSGNEALAQQAVEAERRGDFASAVSAFEQLIKNGADSPELRNNLGLAYFQLHRYEPALNQFRRVLSANPGFAPANLFAGLSLLKLQRPKQAIPYLRKAAVVQPENADAIIALAQADVAAGELSEANSLFQRATNIHPDDPDTWYGLGITSRALAEQTLKTSNGTAREQARKYMDAANSALAHAAELDPNAVGTYMVLGESFRISEQYDEAIQAYKAATDRKPDFAPAWAGLAVAYSAAGRDKDALDAAAHALQLDPKDSGTIVLIAATYLRLSDLVKAKDYARQALDFQPDLSSAHIVLAKIELQEHQPERALPDLRAAVKDDLDGSTYYLLANTLRQLGKTNEAAIAMQNYKRLHAAHVAPAPSH